MILWLYLNENRETIMSHKKRQDQRVEQYESL
jgi:hypothetical protein